MGIHSLTNQSIQLRFRSHTRFSNQPNNIIFRLLPYQTNTTPTSSKCSSPSPPLLLSPPLPLLWLLTPLPLLPQSMSPKSSPICPLSVLPQLFLLLVLTLS